VLFLDLLANQTFASVGHENFVLLKSLLKFIVGVVNNAFKLAALANKTKLAKHLFEFSCIFKDKPKFISNFKFYCAEFYLRFAIFWSAHFLGVFGL